MCRHPGHDAVADGPQSAHPVGHPISHSANSGFSRGAAAGEGGREVGSFGEDAVPGVVVVGSGREPAVREPAVREPAVREVLASNHIRAAIDSGVPQPLPLYPLAFSTSRRASHVCNPSPS